MKVIVTREAALDAAAALETFKSCAPFFVSKALSLRLNTVINALKMLATDERLTASLVVDEPALRGPGEV